ncbi:MAG: 3'-5' exonuclease [Saccharothrix sp.]|nr:3'-5' exonuclease [Saccharothrix sp.]
MLEPGAAVILDTETTDLWGSVIEIAVVDACTGKVLLNTLVHPGDVPISPGAHAVHGLTLDALAGAPDWRKVMPKLRKVTRGRTILAYNAEFDRGVITGDCTRHGLKPMHLADAANWGCVMNRRSDFVGTNRWLRLGGGHRALGDCQSARDVLLDIARLDQRGTA